VAFILHIANVHAHNILMRLQLVVHRPSRYRM